MPCRCFICYYIQKGDSKISFHGLPSKPHLRYKWLQELNWQGPLVPNTQYYVCSSHFSSSSITTGKRKRLRKGALPGLNVSQELSSSEEDSVEIEQNVVMLEEQVTSFEETVIENEQNVDPLSVMEEEVTSSNLNTLSERRNSTGSTSSTLTLSSPSQCESVSSYASTFSGKKRIAKLKKRRPIHFGEYTIRHMEDKFLRRQYFEKSQALVKKLKLKIKNLQQQNNRLKKSANKLSDLLLNLQKQI